jgi:CDP-diacylglycerol--glycerol-3-phosphate 3-phosphatidyltransferase
MIDGKIARKYNLITDFGKFIDPLADKFLVFAALLGILTNEYFATLRPIFIWAAAIVIFRELAVTSIRLVAAGKSGLVIAASWLGKIKTVTQMVCICTVLLEPVIFRGLTTVKGYPILSCVTIAAMTVMTLWSGIDYFKGYAKYLKEEGVTPKRPVHIGFTSYEEVGHGGAADIPDGVTEMISVDMGCVGEGLTCDETMVSICAKDAGGPYDYDVNTALVTLAQKNNIRFAVDVFTNYSSDVNVSVKAGHNLRHACIGPGVYASHGYERSHKLGVEATFELIRAYLG